VSVMRLMMCELSAPEQRAFTRVFVRVIRVKYVQGLSCVGGGQCAQLHCMSDRDGEFLHVVASTSINHNMIYTVSTQRGHYIFLSLISSDADHLFKILSLTDQRCVH